MATKGKGMLRETLTGVALILFGVLSSVKGNEGFSGKHFPYDSFPNLIVGFKENCPDHLDAFSCLYLDSKELLDSQSSNPDKSRENDEITRGRKLREKEEFPEESFQEMLINFPENQLHKRLLVQRRKNPTARGYKRGPGFRSWGGKRDPTPSGQNPDKRNNKFGPWGGKRDEEFLPSDFPYPESDEISNKRTKFVSWGGKRNPTILNEMIKRGSIWKDRRFYQNEPFIKNVPKRPQFQSWGGKRALYSWHQIYDFFNSQPSRFNNGEKRKFSSWGGKRNNGNSQIRNVFQNWGGKRDGSQEVEEGVPNDSDNDTTRAKEMTAAKTDWESEEPSLTSNAWEEKEKEKNDR